MRSPGVKKKVQGHSQAESKLSGLGAMAMVFIRSGEYSLEVRQQGTLSPPNCLFFLD